MKKTFLIAWLVMMIILAISVVSFAEEVTLRFSWWGSQDRADRTYKVIKLFEEKYPNVKIEPEIAPGLEYFERLSVQAAGKNLPDVFQNVVEYSGIYIRKGVLLVLDPYVEDNRLNLTDVSETEMFRFIDGKMYGVSMGSNSPAYFYDPELFKKAGVEEPNPDWTWEDYIEKCKKIHEALGIYADDPYIMNSTEPKGFEHYLRQHGMNLYDSSYKKLGYEDDSLFVDYWTMLVDLIKDGVNTPPEVSLEVTQNALEEYLIVTQEVAMNPASSNQLIGLVAAAGRPLSLALWPNAKDQVRYANYTKPSMVLEVAKTSKYPEWAVKFIDFFTNDLEANKILLAERGIPISSKIREGIKPYLDDVQNQVVDYLDLVIKRSSPFVFYYPPGYEEITNLQKIITEKLFFGELTPEKAAKEWREKANEILTRKYEEN